MNSWVSAAAAGVALGAPLAYAALGELIAERAGVMNLGVEGMMLMGAVIGFIVTTTTGNPWLGFLAAMAAGCVLGSVHAFMVVTLRTNQIVMGLTLTILGTGLSAYLGAGYAGQRPRGTLDVLPIPLLSGLPVLGPILFNHDVLVYGAALVGLVTWFGLYRTSGGLSLRAAGEHPGAADATGLPVSLIRHAAVLTGGALAGVGGAYYSIVYIHSWADGMIAGRGWIAIALVIFASWEPLRVLVGAVLFGVVDSLNFQLQSIGVPISSDVLAMLPYIFTLIALAATWTRAQRRGRGMPAALGIPYEREARA